MATWLSRWRKYKGRYIDAKGVSREGLWKAAACDVSTWGPSRSQHIDTHCFLLDVSYCAASAIGHVYACNTLRSSLWILMNSIRGWELNIEPTITTEAIFRSSSVRLDDCVLLPWQGGTRIRWRDEDASWGSRLRHLFHREAIPRSKITLPKVKPMSNKVVKHTFRVSKILLLFILQQFGRNVEDTSLQQNGRHGRLELLQCPHDWGGPKEGCCFCKLLKPFNQLGMKFHEIWSSFCSHFLVGSLQHSMSRGGPSKRGTKKLQCGSCGNVVLRCLVGVSAPDSSAYVGEAPRLQSHSRKEPLRKSCIARCQCCFLCVFSLTCVISRWAPALPVLLPFAHSISVSRFGSKWKLH